MPKHKNKGRKNKGSARAYPTQGQLAKDGLESRKFTFNNYSQITLRNSWFSTYANQQCYVAFYVDVNGFGWNLYDGLGGAIPGTAFNTNYSSVFGAASGVGAIGATGQFPQWADIYSLYTVEEIGLRFTPFSFTATGSQGPMTLLTGGQGIVAALIESGSNLNPQIFSGMLGDAKNLRMVMPFKQGKSRLDYRSLIPAECPTTFRQTIAEGFDSGFRQLFPSRTRYGRAAGDPDVLTAQLPALVGFMPFTFNDDQLNTGKALGIFQPWCRMRFQQRRNSIAALSSRAFRAFKSAQLKDTEVLAAAWTEQLACLDEGVALPQDQQPSGRSPEQIVSAVPAESSDFTSTPPLDRNQLAQMLALCQPKK